MAVRPSSSSEGCGFALASTLTFIITIDKEEASIRSNAAACIPSVCEDPSLVTTALVQPARGLIE